MTPHDCEKYDEINDLSKTLALTTQTMMNIEKAVQELKQQVKEGFEKQEKKFAGKWVEKVFIFIGAVIGTALVGAILTLILKK